MRWQIVAGWVPWALVVAVLSSTSPARAQILNAPAGVVVDAQGVLHKQVAADPDGRLTRERIAAASAALEPDVAAVSKLRKVSLNRLEQAIRDCQGAPTDEMRYLAGLQRVRYVFFYPETKDIVLAGPAEGWVTDPDGPRRGHHQRPADVQLQDLVVALAGVSARRQGDRRDRLLDRSDAEGLAAMQQFLESVGIHATPSAKRNTIVDGLQQQPGQRRTCRSTAFRPRRISPRSWSRPTTG